MNNQQTEQPLTNNTTSLYDLMQAVLSDTNIKTTKEKIDLIDELRKNNPSTTDRWSYRYAIWFLGASVLITIISMCVLAALEKDVPDGLIAIGSAVAGGIAGLLSPAPRTGPNNN
jgi:hypothetical protein